MFLTESEQVQCAGRRENLYNRARDGQTWRPAGTGAGGGDAMADYRAGIIGLGFIGAGDQVSGDALGQRVEDLDGTHASALAGHPRIESGRRLQP